MPQKVGLGLAIMIVFGFAATWWIRIIPRQGPLSTIASVSALDRLSAQKGEIPILVLSLLLLGLLFLRHRNLLRAQTFYLSLAVLLSSVGLSLLLPFGHHVAIVASTSAIALLVGLQLPLGWMRSEPSLRRDRIAAAGLWTGITIIHCIFSFHRHWAFGSGSWDHGCMVHNFYRTSRFLESTSTVLGNVDFLGDHFMIGLYLYAPIMWIDSSGYAVLFIQAANVAAAAPAIYLIARHHQAARVPAIVLAICVGLAFGMQSGNFFDSHEITVGIGFLAWGLWAFETKRLRLATLLFVLFALFKESLGAYVAALGLLALWRGYWQRDKRLLIYGAGWILFGAVWFVLVNRVFMPILIARANPPEPHETFRDFGPTIFEAAVGIVTHPLKALGALFAPETKVASHAVTFGSTGWLAVLAPQTVIAAAPLFAERFLSSKQTMWEMGYHYAAPLTLYVGWATAAAWPRIERVCSFLLKHLEGVTQPTLPPRAPAVIACYLLTSMLLVNTWGYRHPANYLKWREGYFSKADQQKTNARAVDFLRSQGRDASLAVQNRILPHLADRPEIYRLGEWQKVDWVLLSVGESAWPWDNGYPLRLARQLRRTPGWHLVFSEGKTAVFTRTPAIPAVKPAPQLRLPPPLPSATSTVSP